MNLHKSILIGLFCLLNCHESLSQSPAYYKKVGDIPVPEGFVRQVQKKNSFCQFLRKQGLKRDKTVYLYNGRKKANQSAQFAVLNIDVGKRNLQQCADAIMRLRGEYLYQKKQYAKIRFHFTNGDLVPFVKYARGYRPKIRKNRVTWRKTKRKSYSYTTFRRYMELIFTYAGTSSLRKELKPIASGEIQCGDSFVQAGYPYGHAVLLVDLAVHKQTGKKIFLLAQSYMPAQDIHVLQNPQNADISPWYEVPQKKLLTPEWEFIRQDLRRF
ncbi:MAG: DUF4846 domain-containing protein [Spirochaetota bacterium]